MNYEEHLPYFYQGRGDRAREEREKRETERERREGSSWMKTVEHFAKQTNRKYVGGKTTQGRHGQEERRFSLSLFPQDFPSCLQSFKWTCLVHKVVPKVNGLNN